ncbi:diguanylate cyclase [Actinoplanes sp. NPDC051346]|uniref:GGDEF domain-containing protein n=1 Tax=Actinoplanes sp. NPDC051346 TaxID=3155048 RepID=UPI00342BC8F0
MTMMMRSGTQVPLDAARMAQIVDEYEDLADFDIAEAETAARVIGRAAGETELRWRARLLQADLLERRGELASAAKMLVEVLQWAQVSGCRRVRARAHRVLARLYHAMGDVAANLEHMIQCVDALDDTTPASGRIACLVKLADAYAETGSMSSARDRYEQAILTATDHGNAGRQLMALNNYAYAEYNRGDLPRARHVLERLRAAGAEHGRPLGFSALDTVARVEALLGDLAAADRAAREALRTYRDENAEEAGTEADLLLTLAFVQRLRGELDDAQQTIDRVRALCSRHALRPTEVQALFEQAEIKAAAGDFARAYATMHRFHTAEKRLQWARREAQARNRQALSEVDEARRQAEWFRDQARRDPLTGLHNRRFIDEHLPALLEKATDDGSPVTVALLDLDHFKRVNDTLSHETGNEVLAIVAAMLGRADAGSSGFAARIGGEEFLLVVTGVDVASAALRLEDLRQAVAGHPWRPVTGELPVTVSIGVTAAMAGDTQSGVLARADEALYEAKHGGRNRLCLDAQITVAERRRFRDGLR